MREARNERQGREARERDRVSSLGEERGGEEERGRERDRRNASRERQSGGELRKKRERDREKPASRSLLSLDKKLRFLTAI